PAPLRAAKCSAPTGSPTREGGRGSVYFPLIPRRGWAVALADTNALQSSGRLSMTPLRFDRRWIVSQVALLLILTLAAGCGNGEGKVSGKVLYNGKPVPGGRITFRPADSGKNRVQ